MSKTSILLLQVILQLLHVPASISQCRFSNALDSVVDIPEEDVEDVEDVDRVDCHPEPHSDQDKCEARGCVWKEGKQRAEPWCYYPPGYGYVMSGAPLETETGFLIHLVKSASSGTMFGGEADHLWAEISFQTRTRIRINISDNKPRFQVPIHITSDQTRPQDPLYQVKFTASPTWGFQVIRSDTGETVIDTSLPGLVFSDQFMQIPIKLPKGSNLYGWGENSQQSLQHPMDWKTYGLYARDQPPDGDTNMYGVHPKLTILDKNGDASAILFLNSAAQEISVTPAPGVIYRTIGGLLDIYIFVGPTPEEVVQQYTQAIGRYYIPPYWSLGFHLCKYGYNSLENMQAAVDRTLAHNIPQDAQWGDIDIMDRRLDFTLDNKNFSGLPAYVKQLKARGVKFVTILDPCISTGEPECTYKPFDLGQELGVWVMNSNGSPTLGRVWPDDPVYFADFTNPRTHLWWETLIQDFHQTLGWDGLWIDMNEPSNFHAGDLNQGCGPHKLNYPPYVPSVRKDKDALLADKTLCGDSRQWLGAHYDTHNLYGWAQSQPTLAGVRKATGKRGLVLSRSTYVGSGQWVAHWLGDNFSNWQNLKNSIIGILQFNQFGIPFVGADICGFIGNTNAQLCARWHQLGAFYPFSRNHNALGNMDQDPGVFGDEVASIARAALRIRYWLLPHLYTLFYHHSTDGSTVVRPLWHEFPRDNNTWTIDDEFLWGSSLLVSPIVEEDASTRRSYLPSSSRWFRITHYFNNQSDWEEVSPGWVDLDAPLEVIHLHLRGGIVVPLQEPALNTHISRSNPFELLITMDENDSATGSLFWDDGDSIDTVESEQYFLGHMRLYAKHLVMQVEKDGVKDMQFLHLTKVVILGLREPVTEMTVNGEPCIYCRWTYHEGRLDLTNLKLSINDGFQISFQ